MNIDILAIILLIAKVVLLVFVACIGAILIAVMVLIVAACVRSIHESLNNARKKDVKAEPKQK